MALAFLRMAKVDAPTVGGNCPAKRERSKGNSPSTTGYWAVTVTPRDHRDRPADPDEPAGNHELCLQKVRYCHFSGEMQEGFRFI